MRIAITADPFIPVPPSNYGGIERIIDFLALGLVKNGHEVLLVANENSKVDVPLLKYPKQTTGIFNHYQNVKTIHQIKQFKPDVIHSFSRLAYLLPFLNSSVQKVMSYQREPTINQIVNANRIFRKGTLSFTGCSNYITNQISPFAKAATVYNGVEMSTYTHQLNVDANAPLVFLGRIEPIKGTHIAIQVAKQANRKLVIAGNIPEAYQTYFDNEIKPHLNSDIVYIGQANDEQKNKLLGSAAALLMPILWNEPFGIVMAEALACGTPVIGFARGAVLEVVKHQVNGFTCNNTDEMVNFISDIKNIDRNKVRIDCESRFSAEVIVSNYLKVYQNALNA